MRIILIIIGCVALGLAVLGLLLPLLPTTPFLLLAAGCFSRASSRLHTWLLRLPFAGKVLEDYASGQGVCLRTKLVALTMLWASLAGSTWVLVGTHQLALTGLLVAAGAGVTVVILRLPSPSSTWANTGSPAARVHSAATPQRQAPAP